MILSTQEEPRGDLGTAALRKTAIESAQKIRCTRSTPYTKNYKWRQKVHLRITLGEEGALHVFNNDSALIFTEGLSTKSCVYVAI